MPTQSFRAGVAGVVLSKKASYAIGSVAAMAFTATNVVPTAVEYNSITNPLPAGSYKVCLAPVARDAVNGGYAVGIATAESAAIPVAAGEVIKVVVANGVFTTNLATAAGIGVFLKLGTGDYQLAKVAYINPSRDFVTHIISLPQTSVDSVTYAVLSTATVTEYLGSRVPLGYDYVRLAPTTGGVDVVREVDQVTFSPDNTRDFPAATTRATTIRFQLLANNVLDVVRSAGGNYVINTHSGVEYEEAEQSIATANVLLTGNQPFRLLMPRDAQGFQENRLYLGGLVVNQAGFTEGWRKSEQTAIQYEFSTAILDRLLIDQHVEIVWKAKG